VPRRRCGREGGRAWGQRVNSMAARRARCALVHFFLPSCSPLLVPPSLPQDDKDAFREASVEFGTALSRDLQKMGAPGLHFYTLNLEKVRRRRLQRRGRGGALSALFVLLVERALNAFPCPPRHR